MSNIRIGDQNEAVHPLLAAAEKATQERDFLRGIELLEMAGQRAPRNPNVFFNLGAMYAKLYDYAGIEKNFERAIELSPDAGQALLSAGGRCVGMGMGALAEKYFSRATRQPNPHPVAFAGMAEVLEGQDKVSEAMDFAARALQIDPECAVALLLRARLLRRSGGLEEAGQILARLVGNSDRKLMVRVGAGCELGRVLDLQKNYDAAMAAVVAAKALLKPPMIVAAGFHRLSQRRRNLEEAGLAKKLEKWFKTEEPPVPLVLMGGRAYASEEVGIEPGLAAHGQIFYLEDSRIFLDEIYFPIWRRFHPETPIVSILDSLTPEALREMRSVYLKRNEVFLQKPIGGRLVVEKNHVLNSLLLIQIRFFPEARFLMMMRDPRDACLENFMQLQPVNPCGYPFLTLAGSVAENVATINHWRQVMAIVGNPQMQIRHEDMVADRDRVSSQVFSFLNVNPAASSSAKTSAPFWGVGNWKNYEKYLEPHLPVLNKHAEAFGY